MRLILFISFLLLGTAQLLAQSSKKEERPPVNQYDKAGKKHGMWWVSLPPKMGEDGVNEFGAYYHGNKQGPWYKVNHLGDIVSIESFRNNFLDGEVKYYQKGQLYCTGNYKALSTQKPFDTIVVVDPITHEESYKVIATQQGTIRHGAWKYYNPETGHMIKEEEYQADELVYQKDYTISAALDSTIRKKHEQRLPHVRGAKYTPPPGKRHSYTR